MDPRTRRRTRHSSGVAGVEDHHEIRVVGQLTIQIDQGIVGDGRLGSPGEIVRHQAGINAPDSAVGSIGGQRLMTAVKEEAYIAGGRAVEQPVQAFKDACCRGSFIEDDSNIFRLESTLLQDRPPWNTSLRHPSEPIGGIGIVVDAHQQLTAAKVHRET